MEYCLCGCGEEIKNNKDMITDGYNWMLCDCAEKIRKGEKSKSGYFSPDGIRIYPPQRNVIFNSENRIDKKICETCEYKNQKDKKQCLNCYNYRSDEFE